MLTSDVQLLQQAALFRSLPLARLKLLAFAGEKLSYQTGETIFKIGEVSDATYVIFEGEVEALIAGPDEDIAVARLGPCDIVGEVGVFTANPRAVTVIAKTATTALRIPAQIFCDLVRDCPECAMGVTKFFAELVERMIDRVALEAQH